MPNYEFKKNLEVEIQNSFVEVRWNFLRISSFEQRLYRFSTPNSPLNRECRGIRFLDSAQIRACG